MLAGVEDVGQDMMEHSKCDTGETDKDDDCGRVGGE